MLRWNRRATGAACAVALGVVAVSPLGLGRAVSAPDTDLSGTWSLAGANGTGKYTGTATLGRVGDDWVASLALAYANGSSGTARITGKLENGVLKGKRLRTTGITGILTGTTRKPVDCSYTLSADGLKLTGTYGSYKEELSRSAPPAPAGKATITADTDRDGKLSEADRTAAAAGKSALLAFAPGEPGATVASLQVKVADGTVRVAVSPDGALKVTKGGVAVSTLPVGTHDLQVSATKEGAAEVQLLSGTTVVDRAKISVEREQAYLILFGYMGTEVNYLGSDLARCKSNILAKLTAAGYKVVEDGQSYDQSVIAKSLSDPNAVKKLVVDWCVTTEDFVRYFKRGTVRGYMWSSHGFMEPYPGCPDNELKTFESRQWTSAPGDPAMTGDKHFIREWRGYFEKNAGKMDFALNHSCCTGGIGDYAHEPWEYCTPATKARAEQVLGTPLPPSTALTYVTHESLKSFTNFMQNYDGSAYFGMGDVRWNDLKASIKP